jgi:hypothetical protein
MLKLKICKNNLGSNLCMYTAECYVYHYIIKHLLLMVNIVL